ncbi:MAG: DUF4416 family protein [Rubripirellula sp.]
MAEVRFVEPVVRFCAIITRHDDALRWATDQLTKDWGDGHVASPAIDFEAGGYYTESMGAGLKKTLIAFGDFMEPGGLADWKHHTNQLELQYAAESGHPESRPLNLDAGYTTQAKLVLATTKDRDHRIYLRDGMFAEVTLTYVGKQWTHHRWSYPSYRTDEVAAFAMNCRNRLRKHLRATQQFRLKEQP